MMDSSKKLHMYTGGNYAHAYVSTGGQKSMYLTDFISYSSK